jgi:secreted PhoX family phosphatase
MRLPAHLGFDSGRDARVGAAHGVDWVDIAETDPPNDTVRFQGHRRGAALVRRGEGIWFHEGAIWFASTSGGPTEAGQIFRITVGNGGGADVLTLIAEAGTTGVLDMPDNLTVSPAGEVFVAEDSPFGDQYLRIIGLDGQISDFARNAVSSSELAGICFSPDGGTLFVNLYLDGMTLAVRGPFGA